MAAVWMWTTAIILNTISNQVSLINFCNKTDIKTLYFSIDNGGHLTNPNLPSFINYAHSNGLQVHALISDYNLALTKNHAKAVSLVQKVLKFKFDGINLDVEPYVISGVTMNDPTQSVHKQYLTLLYRLYTLTKGKVLFGPCVPTFFDTSTTKYCTSVYFMNKTKTLYEHVVDYSDYISIMDYTTDKVRAIKDVEFELQKSKSKSVVIGLNLNPSAGSPYFTSVQAMEDALQYVHNTCKATYPSYNSVAIHYYQLYTEQRDPNAPPVVYA